MMSHSHYLESLVESLFEVRFKGPKKSLTV